MIVWNRLSERYFVYRSQYVAYFDEHAPNRVGLAILSEVARLAFVVAGAALCSLIFGALTAGAARSAGRGAWAFPFAALTAFSLAILVRAARSAFEALAALRAYRNGLLNN